MSFCFSFAVKNSTLIIAKKIDFGVSNAPKYEIDTKELYNIVLKLMKLIEMYIKALFYSGKILAVGLCAIFVLVVASLVII